MSEEMETCLTFEEAERIARCSTAALRERWRREKLLTVKFGKPWVLIERAVLMAQLRRRSVR